MFDSLSFPVKMMDIPHPIVAGEKIKGRKAIIRTDTNDVLNIVSNKYPLTLHKDVFGPLQEALNSIGLPVTKITEKSANSGGYGKVTWDLDKSFKIEDGDIEDKLNVTISARNSYNYASVVALELGIRREISQTYMPVGRVLKGTSSRHVPNLNVPEMIKQITLVLLKTKDVQDRITRWAGMSYSREDMVQWIEKKPFSKKARQEIVDYFTIQPDRIKLGASPAMNGWEAVSALAWFGSRVKSRRADTLLLAEERVLEIAQVFTREQLV